MDSSVSPKQSASPMQPSLARSLLKGESPETPICCSPQASPLKMMPHLEKISHAQREDGTGCETTTQLDVGKDHRQLLQRSFC